MNGTLTNKGQGLENNPQNINRNGRPRKGISMVNAQLKEKGYDPASKNDIECNYMAMIQLTQEELTEFANDKKQPMLVRIIAKNMLDRKGFEIIERMLDRGIGKPKQTEDINIKGDITLKQIEEMTDEELDAHIKSLS